MNILIADSGSTKTEWVLLSENGTETLITPGINPVHMPPEEIRNLLLEKMQRPAEGIRAVRFYGAGCIPSRCGEMLALFRHFFHTEDITVESDLLGAARGLFGTRPGVACILGTGSNSARYDGSNIVKNVPPLGYILGDEGSGADLGKRLIGNLLKGLLAYEITDAFYSEFSFQYERIIENVYRQPGANRFLSGFAPFLHKYLGHPDIREIVDRSFADFTERNLLQYRDGGKLSVSFVGSIAFYFAERLREVLEHYGFSVEKIERSPIPGLTDYHKQEFFSTI